MTPKERATLDLRSMELYGVPVPEDAYVRIEYHEGARVLLATWRRLDDELRIVEVTAP